MPRVGCPRRPRVTSGSDLATKTYVQEQRKSGELQLEDRELRLPL